MRRLPPAFVLALVVQAVIVVTRLLLLAGGKMEWLASASWTLTAQGISLVTLSLLAAGASDLARRTSGPAADAARIARIVFSIAVGLSIAGVLVDYFQMTRADGASPSELLYEIESYAWSIVMIGGVAALVTAGDGWRRSPPLAGVAMVAIVISRGPQFLTTPLYKALQNGLGRTMASMVFSLGWLVALGAAIALIAGADKAEPAEDGEACERGLRRMSSALWLRVIAAGAAVLMMVFAMGAGRGGGLSMVKLMMVAGPVLNAFALASFGIGAFTVARSGVRDYSAITLYVAGSLSLWTAGATLSQVPWLYQVFYGDGGSSWGTDRARETAQTLSTVIPLVAAAGVTALTVAIAGFARRRDLQDLRDQTATRAGAFVMLMIVTLLITKYGLPKTTRSGALLAMSLTAGAAALCATVLVAKLCKLAADAVRLAPGLPTATLRE